MKTEFFDQLKSLENLYFKSSDNQRKLLEVNLSLLSQIISNAREEDEVEVVLSSLIKYLKNKSARKITSSDNINIHVLRELRNNFSHGGSGINSEIEFKKYNDVFWGFLTKNSDDFNLYALENFLSYCIGYYPDDEERMKNTDSKKVVNFYKQKYKKMHYFDRERTFRELVLRFFGNEELKMSLKNM